MALGNWAYSEVIEEYGDTIRVWKETEKLGNVRLAKRLTEVTGRLCTPGVMGVVLADLGYGNSKRGRMRIKEENPPAEDPLSVDELIDSRIKAFKRATLKTDIHRRTLTMPDEPFGICCFGDPHVDDESCDWVELTRVVKICQDTPGVVAASVGDQMNNWIGRLMRKFADTSCLTSDGWRLSQWLLEALDWIALVGGNHDQWAHAVGRDPLKVIADGARVRCFANDEIRITLKFESPELEPLIWVIRHDAPGRSWFHPSHGPNKLAMLDGRVHLVTAGHIHTWAYLSQEMPHSRVTHAIRVRGFKRNDEYALSKGFSEDTYGCACMIVVDPVVIGPDRIKVFWDVQRGADYLTQLRG